jgi:hypothetical protein
MPDTASRNPRQIATAVTLCIASVALIVALIIPDTSFVGRCGPRRTAATTNHNLTRCLTHPTLAEAPPRP